VLYDGRSHREPIRNRRTHNLRWNTESIRRGKQGGERSEVKAGIIKREKEEIIRYLEFSQP
jgi:hypothetical protein